MLQSKASLSRLTLVVFAGIGLALFTLLNVTFGLPVTEVDEIEIFFSPENNCGAKILQVLDQAKESIDVAMYSFTNRVLAQSLVGAHLRGVKVRVFMDEEASSQKYSKATYLIGRGVEVKYERGLGLMHNKFCVVDEKIVVTGSFNWTIYADLRNDENLVIINSSEVAKVYKDKFERLWMGKGVDEAVYSNETRLEKTLLH